MDIHEKAAAILRREDLALTLASRPDGTTISELAAAAGIPWETARAALTMLVRRGDLVGEPVRDRRQGTRAGRWPIVYRPNGRGKVRRAARGRK